MLFIQRKIRCKYTGPEKWCPENVKPDTWMPVIGYRTNDKIIIKGDEKKRVQDLFYFVIGNDGQITNVASFNCQTMLDEKTVGIKK